MAIKVWGAGLDGAGNGNWSTATKWTGNTVPADQDDVDINNGDIVTFDVDLSGLANGLASLDIDSGSLLTHATNANTYLKMDDDADIILGATTPAYWAIGIAGSPIDAARTAMVEMNPSANGLATIVLNANSTLDTAGNATWGRGAAAWVSEIFDDGVGAAANDDHIHITDDLDVDVFNNVLILIEQTSGTYTHYDLMQASAWTDEGGGSYKIEFDYNEIEGGGGDTDLTYAHAVGAKVYVVSRNVQIFSGTGHGWSFDDNATTTLTTCLETYLRDSYRHNTQGNGSSFDHCVFDLIEGSPGLFYLSGGYGLHYNWDDVLICRNELYATLISSFNGFYNLNNVHFQGIDSRVFYSGTIGLYWRGGRCNTRKTGVLDTLRLMSGSFIENVEFEAALAGEIIVGASAGNLDIRTCNISDDLLTGSLSRAMRCMLNNTLIGGDLTAGYGAVYSINHNQDPGAVRAEIHGSIIEKQATTTYDGSDWALEITPGAYITSDNPLWVKLADIPCGGFDTFTVTGRCAVNTAYGHASGDPVLVLDRGDCHGIETEVAWVLTSDSNPPEAADWEIATTGSQTPAGGDVDILVELWIKIPYYAAGSAVFVDDIQVTGANVDSDQISYWPGAQVRAAAAGGGAVGRGFNRGMA